MADKPIVTPPQGDLPENWITGQIVAPDGTEVGLTEQHGYNHLMQLVNALANGVTAINDAFSLLASLGDDGKIPAEELPSMDFIPTSQKGKANGVASLNESGKVPLAQLLAGVAGGLATLNANGKVPLAQLLAGVANGLATLDAGVKVPIDQIPNLNTNKITSGILPVLRGGTGKSSFTANRLLYGAFAQLATPSQDSVLMQAGNAAPYWSTIAALAEKLGQNNIARVQTGSYVGTGTYGQNNPCSLTFYFVPKVVLITSSDQGLMWAFINSCPKYVAIGSDVDAAAYTGAITWSGASVSWYTTWAQYMHDYGQANHLGQHYYWLAVG